MVLGMLWPIWGLTLQDHIWSRNRIRWYRAQPGVVDLGNGAGRNRLVELTHTKFHLQVSAIGKSGHRGRACVRMPGRLAVFCLLLLFFWLVFLVGFF